MATIVSTTLSSFKKGEQKEIKLRLFVSQSVRPRFSTGIFVNPNYFDEDSGEIIVPRAGKRNMVDVNDANSAKNRLDIYKTDLLAIVNVYERKLGKDISVDNIRKSLELVLKYGIPTDEITYDVLKNLIESEKKQEEAQKKQSRKKTIIELANMYLSAKNYAISKQKNFKVIIRDILRYERFVRMTAKESAKREVYGKSIDEPLTASEKKNVKKQHEYNTLVERYQTFTFDVDTITKDTINDFRDYLRNEWQLSEQYPTLFAKLLKEVPHYTNGNHKKGATRKIEQRAENSIIIIMKGLNTFFKWLNNSAITQNHPFDGVEIGTEKYPTEPYFLTKEERDKVADFDLSDNKALETQRDIFIFHCLVGCRVSDLLTLRHENIVNGVLTYNPQKTRHDETSVKPRVPLNARALALVEKYDGVDAAGRLFPFISAQKYNDAIKNVLKAAKVERNVTIINPITGKAELHPICEVASSHMARRTFVGNLYHSIKDPSLIGSMSGHKEGSRAFARYRNISDDDLREVISIL